MRSVIAFAILIGSVSAALAQDGCIEPPVPAKLDGAPSADRMRAALAEARHFIAQSSLYQDCLLKEVEAAKLLAAASGMPFEPMVETSARLKIAASRKAQQRVGDEVNGAITAARMPPN
ncbi:MAG: hypothetical protein V4601_05790 [Pseudomonadota bacterium]